MYEESRVKQNPERAPRGLVVLQPALATNPPPVRLLFGVPVPRSSSLPSVQLSLSTEDGAKRDFHFLFGTSGYPPQGRQSYGGSVA
jgi:hypothetical protein